MNPSCNRRIAITLGKHILVLAVLFLIFHPSIAPLVEKVGYRLDQQGQVVLPKNGDPLSIDSNTVAAVITLVGLLLASSVPGFFEFSFRDTRDSMGRFWLGVALTAMHLGFIGATTLVGFELIRILPGCSPVCASSLPKWIFGLFWLTMLLFDCMDVCTVDPEGCKDSADSKKNPQSPQTPATPVPAPETPNVPLDVSCEALRNDSKESR